MREYKIGTTVATLKPLSWYGIPVPNTYSYLPWAVRRKTGGGVYKGYGYPRASWEWSRLSSHTLWEILSMFNTTTDASVSLYICTYRDTGVPLSYATFQAIMLRPLDGNGKSIFPRSLSCGSVNYTNITLTFEHLVEVP